MRVSVIIPVYNGGSQFQSCLEALHRTHYENWECIVVDDGSTDGSGDLGERYGAQVIKSLRPQSGPAHARNQGAQVANGDVLFFTDADVLVTPNTITDVVHAMQTNSEVAACFGSYNDSPTEPDFLSQYRNLLHHYVHQISNEDATTFWSGCGAIRRNIFLELGGFNTSAYARPSIEDIELGYRLHRAGHRIKLVKSLQVAHMKQWTVQKILITDIYDRAIPWTRLILQGGGIRNDLNLRATQRVSAAATLIGCIALPAGLILPGAFQVAMVAVIILLVFNRGFYYFLYEKRGIGFTLNAIPWHWLYFLYSGLCFVGCLIQYQVLKFYNLFASNGVKSAQSNS